MAHCPLCGTMCSLPTSVGAVRRAGRWVSLAAIFMVRRSALWEAVRDGQWSAEELLQRIDATWVDGDSRYKMSVYAIITIEQCAPGSGPRVQ